MNGNLKLKNTDNDVIKPSHYNTDNHINSNNNNYKIVIIIMMMMISFPRLTQNLKVSHLFNTLELWRILLYTFMNRDRKEILCKNCKIYYIYDSQDVVESNNNKKNDNLKLTSIFSKIS